MDKEAKRLIQLQRVKEYQQNNKEKIKEYQRIYYLLKIKDPNSTRKTRINLRDYTLEEKKAYYIEYHRDYYKKYRKRLLNNRRMEEDKVRDK